MMEILGNSIPTLCRHKKCAIKARIRLDAEENGNGDGDDDDDDERKEGRKEGKRTMATMELNRKEARRTKAMASLFCRARRRRRRESDGKLRKMGNRRTC